MRFVIVVLLVLAVSSVAQKTVLAQSDRPIDSRPQFLETLKALQLTEAQTTEVRTLIRQYRGKYRTEKFRVALLNVLTAEQAQKLEQLQNPNPKAVPKDYQVDADVVYGRRQGTAAKFLSLDIYRKREAKQKRPVMVMIHGGGWCIGDKANKAVGVEKGRFFADQSFVYVSINYRLTPAVTHPGHIVDVAEAIAWVHDNIGEYGGDPESIFVMGHSAGAQLAALVATDHRRLGKHQKTLSILDGVILLDGAGYDIPGKLKISNSVANKMYTNAFTSDEDVQRDASPIQHVSTDKSIPPFLIIPIAGRLDSNKQSQELARAINQANGEATVHIAEGKTHSSLNSEIGRPNDKPTAAIMKFLEKQSEK